MGEKSDYRHQDLSLAKGWYEGKTSENVKEKTREPLGMSTVESGTSGRMIWGFKKSTWGFLGKMLSIFLFLSAVT